MRFHILTLFPDMVEQGLHTSIIGRAVEKGLLTIEAVNIRDYTVDKHKKVDDYPYGGGAGMVMQAQPIYDAYLSIVEKIGYRPRTIYLTPQGPLFTQQAAKEFALEEDVILLCGHYEGVDQRVLDAWDMEEVSIGDYILTGGELPAMVLIDSVARFIPQVLGAQESATEESIYSGLLECDQYTKPQVYEEMAVPEVLYSGNHKLIHLAQYRNALELTQARRPDLFRRYIEKVEKEKTLTKEERKILEEIVRKTTGS